jgi:transposase-like protein
MAKKKKNNKKIFTEAQRAAALEMVAEGSTLKQTADHFGCSVASLQAWKKRYGSKAKTAVKRAVEKTHNPPEPTVPLEKPKAQVPFDKFVRKFWEKRAVDVVLMDSAKRDEILDIVHEALQYSYDALR